MTYAQSADLEKFVRQFSDGVCYGIEWTLADSGRLECKSQYNPSWRVEAVRKNGLESLYTTKSKEFTFAPGEGFVGKTFASQKKLFVEDLQACAVDDMINVVALSAGEQLLRADIAKEFGIRSAIFVPTPNGVLEAGSTQRVVSESDLCIQSTISDDMIRQITPPAPASTVLKQIVEMCGGACYGIEWIMSDGGMLECKSFYNPDWRIEAVQKKGLHGLYTTKSSTYTFKRGEGFVGKAFENQQVLFTEDLQSQSETDMMDTISLGVHSGFHRVELAREFGIHSAAFMPTATGVVEVGSTQKVQSADALLSGAIDALKQIISGPILDLAGIRKGAR